MICRTRKAIVILLNPRRYFLYGKIHKTVWQTSFGIVESLKRKCHTFDSNQSDSDSGDTDTGVMDLKRVVKKLRALAPTTLAADWDNTGLLLEPSSPLVVSSMLLTNDLSLPVMDEALEKQVNIIVAYHPPIFVPLKRLTQRSWKEVITLKCAENQIALYSPHTACDAVQGGVNDWLISPFDGKVDVLDKCYESNFPMIGGFRLEFAVPGTLSLDLQKQLNTELSKVAGVTVVATSSLDNDCMRFYLNCTENAVTKVMVLLNKYEDVRCSVEIFKSEKPPIPQHGQGRICKLTSAMTVQDVVIKVKAHLDLTHVRLATAVGADGESTVKTIAVCAGSGSSVLRGVEADLYITGEMSHHEVLDATHKGVTVILCDHTNTERGYLKVMKERLTEALEDQVEIHVSQADRDPLQIV